LPGERVRPLNVIFLVVDSLRARSLRGEEMAASRVPFLSRLDATATTFRRAYATECWTLPSHMSMFTGLMPSRHGAHFRNLGYTGTDPTIAEILSGLGHRTELVTRNSIFEGSIPGVTRGFQTCTRPLAEVGRLDPLAIMLALSKPRFRRQVRSGGFFHPLQKQSRDFVRMFARAVLPADRLALDHVLERATHHRRAGERFFIFANLYDVHAPYPPTDTSILRPFWAREALLENLMMPVVLPKLGAHRYIRKGFRMSALARRLLLQRYLSAIELMDRKLSAFYDAARGSGVLDDTLLVITSDHGEGFGEHGLYLHDSSVFETHLHVPLWILHPDRPAELIDDVVSTLGLFDLMRAAGSGDSLDDTILSAEYRRTQSVAHAEHFHYAGYDDILPQYRQDLRAIIGATRKVIMRETSAETFDLSDDPDETRPGSSSGDRSPEWYGRALMAQ
jgi:arylsulfatase A-like enzyme